MEEQDLNSDSNSSDNLNHETIDQSSSEPIEENNSIEENASVVTAINNEIQEEKDISEVGALDNTQINQMTEPEYVYSLIESAIPNKDGFRKNIGKRDFALWVLPIVAINTIRRFTSKRTQDIVRPFDETTSDRYLIKGTETVYTSTKNVFEGKDKMRFFGFRFMSIWVFPMAITGAFMEFLFVGPLNGTNPFS